VSKDKPDVAYPTIAINAKIEALGGLGRNQEALALASKAMQRASNYHLAGHLYELYQARAGVYGRMGDWNRASDARSIIGSELAFSCQIPPDDNQRSSRSA